MQSEQERLEIKALREKLPTKLKIALGLSPFIGVAGGLFFILIDSFYNSERLEKFHQSTITIGGEDYSICDTTGDGRIDTLSSDKFYDTYALKEAIIYTTFKNCGFGRYAQVLKNLDSKLATKLTKHAYNKKKIKKDFKTNRKSPNLK